MRRYQDKIATILGMVVVISTLATGCGSAVGSAQSSCAGATRALGMVLDMIITTFFAL